MLILLDQDGVLADFERGVHEGWRQQYGGEAPIAAQRRASPTAIPSRRTSTR